MLFLLQHHVIYTDFCTAEVFSAEGKIPEKKIWDSMDEFSVSIELSNIALFGYGQIG